MQILQIKLYFITSSVIFSPDLTNIYIYIYIYNLHYIYRHYLLEQYNYGFVILTKKNIYICYIGYRRD
jgi:hypothetical protein